MLDTFCNSCNDAYQLIAETERSTNLLDSNQHPKHLEKDAFALINNKAS